MDDPRSILHVDMDAFFAAVEQRDHPELRGKPVLIGHDGPRGVVATASYEARTFGCHSAQPMSIAKRRCPDAIIVSHRGAAYREASHRVFEVLERFSPLVQPLSIDEAFLDVTGSRRLLGSAVDIARRIKREVREATQLTASVGVAPNKFLAKIASDLDKPDGLTVITPQDVPRVLAELPIEAIPGVGPAAARKFHDLNVRTIRDAQSLDLKLLEKTFGSSAQWYWNISRGIDDRPVVTDGEAKSIGHEMTFGVDMSEPEEIRRVMLDQTDDVARRLRRHDLLARTVTVKIRYGDFETITRSRTLDTPTAHTDTLWPAAWGLFETWMTREGFRPVRLIGVTTTQFDHQPQVTLFEDPEEPKRVAIEAATDKIADKFGKAAIRRAGAMKKEEH